MDWKRQTEYKLPRRKKSSPVTRSGHLNRAEIVYYIYVEMNSSVSQSASQQTTRSTLLLFQAHFQIKTKVVSATRKPNKYNKKAHKLFGCDDINFIAAVGDTVAINNDENLWIKFIDIYGLLKRKQYPI